MGREGEALWGAEGYPEVARDRGAMWCRGWGQRRSKSWRRGQAEAEGEVDARGLGRQGRRRACPWSKVEHRAWRRPQGATGGRGAKGWPLHDIVLLHSFIVGVIHPFMPPPPAKPTLLQYYCTTIAQCTPPHRPPLCMPGTIQYR